MTATVDGVVFVDCKEYGYVDVDPGVWLGAGHATTLSSEIDGKDVLRATFNNGRVRLQATSFVGVIPLNESVVVRVRPRVPLANLTRMVVATGHDVLPLAAFREYSGRGTADEWTMELYTDALIDYVDVLLDRGLVRRYERRNGEGHYPRGRIELGQTVARFAAQGAPNRAAYSWFERSVDTPANRCVRAAMTLVHSRLAAAGRQPHKGDRARLSRLSGQFHAFDDVSDDPDLHCLEDEEVAGFTPLPDSRAYYRPALDLAALILRRRGIALEVGGSDVRMASLLIDTNKLFEKFVRVSLAEHAAREGWPVEVLDGNTAGRVDLYDVPAIAPAPLGFPMDAVASRDPGKAQPDVVLRGLNGRFLLVAEVKNTVHGAKTDLDSLPDRGEVEQAVTYALRYDLSVTVLVHPWLRGSRGLVYVGRVRSIDVYDYRLDLSSDDRIDHALADMAVALARLAGSPGLDADIGDVH